MRRREFLGGLSASIVALSPDALAQDRVRRIGLLMPSPEGDLETQHRLQAFRQALGALGWVEGRNVRFDVRWAVGEPARIAAAKELMALNPEVVIGASTPVATALQRESRTTPIVFTQVGDPIGSGFAASLPNPGGNLTGFTNYEPAMATKWLQLVKEISPGTKVVGALFNPQTHSGQYWQALDTAARLVGVEFRKAPVQDVSQLEQAIEELARQSGNRLAVMPDIFVFNNRERLVSLTAQHRVPAIYPFRYFAEIGGLIAYGIDNIDMYRRAAVYADRILRGTNPQNLPIEAPKKFELVINLKTARALGIDVSPTLLASADQVIE